MAIVTIIVAFVLEKERMVTEVKARNSPEAASARRADIQLRTEQYFNLPEADVSGVQITEGDQKRYKLLLPELPDANQYWIVRSNGTRMYQGYSFGERVDDSGFELDNIDNLTLAIGTTRPENPLKKSDLVTIYTPYPK